MSARRAMAGPCHRIRIAVAVVGFCALARSSPSSAHPVLADYVRHVAVMTVGPRHIDVQIELTFYELRSAIERHRMDADHDGTISCAEIREYLTDRADSLEASVHLTVRGRPVALVPLYDPEVDLQASNGVEPFQHILRLFYFANTPAGLLAGDEIDLEDGLWPSAPAVRSLEAIGKDGVCLTRRQMPDSASAAAGQARVSIRCLKVPSYGTAQAAFEKPYRSKPLRVSPAPATYLPVVWRALVSLAAIALSLSLATRAIWVCRHKGSANAIRKVP